MPTRFKALREFVLLALLSLATFLVVGEIVMRVYLARNIFYDVEMTRYSIALKQDAGNPKIGHVHRPDSSAFLMGVDVTTNAQGFRDDELPLARTDAHRILFLGDSLTFGWGVAHEDTFASRLERRMSEDRPTEILNTGAGNYNTVQEVELFHEKGLDYDPDQVVLFYFINDAEPVPTPSKLEWLGHSRLVTFYWSRIKALLARSDDSVGFEAYYRALYADDQPGWIAARGALERLATTCREHGIDLRVVLLPELHQLDPYLFEAEYQKVSAHLESLGVPVLDLAPAFRAEPDPHRLWVALDDAHPNARAHDRIATHTLPFLSPAEGS